MIKTLTNICTKSILTPANFAFTQTLFLGLFWVVQCRFHHISDLPRSYSTPIRTSFLTLMYIILYMIKPIKHILRLPPHLSLMLLLNLFELTHHLYFILLLLNHFLCEFHVCNVSFNILGRTLNLPEFLKLFLLLYELRLQLLIFLLQIVGVLFEFVVLAKGLFILFFI